MINLLVVDNHGIISFDEVAQSEFSRVDWVDLDTYQQLARKDAAQMSKIYGDDGLIEFCLHGVCNAGAINTIQHDTLRKHFLTTQQAINTNEETSHSPTTSIYPS